MSSTSTGAPVVGLRERKKARLHEALLDSGMRLFHEHGYERTTTEEIAAGAGVSQRTFFRYFPSKEALVLEALHSVDELLVDALHARPAHEHPLTALRNALSDQWDHIECESLLLRGSAVDLLRTNPELMEAHMRYCHARQKRLASVVAERAGVDPDTDSRPELVSAVFFAAINTGYGVWAASGATDDDLLRNFLEQLDLLPEAVGGDWGTPAAPDSSVSSDT